MPAKACRGRNRGHTYCKELLPSAPRRRAGLVVCVRGIVSGKLTVGDAVLFLSLMSQLVAPLSFFGSYYRQVGRWQ